MLPKLVALAFYETSFNLNFRRLWQEKPNFFEGWSWFKFNNLGLPLVRNLKFYASVVKS